MENTPGWKVTEMTPKGKERSTTTDHKWSNSHRIDSLAFGYCHSTKRSSMISTFVVVKFISKEGDKRDVLLSTHLA